VETSKAARFRGCPKPRAYWIGENSSATLRFDAAPPPCLAIALHGFFTPPESHIMPDSFKVSRRAVLAGVPAAALVTLGQSSLATST
jgi:hypothetical protein